MPGHLPLFELSRPDSTLTLLGREYSLRSILHMVIIVCGYLIIRPYLLKLSARYQTADHARTVDDNPGDSMAATGRKVDRDDSEDDSEDGWGSRARRRERERRKREEDAKRKEEQEEDAELESMLQG
jgi:hypothetical protein